MEKLSRRIWKGTLFLMAGLFMLLGACQPQMPPPLPLLPPDQPTYRVEKVTADALNVRRSPSNQGEILTVLSKGSMVQIVGRDGDWIQILTPRKQYGWVFGAYLTGFEDIKRRHSARETVNSRPAIPQGMSNTDQNLRTYPNLPEDTPADVNGTAVPADTNLQGDDFPSGFDGASE